MVNKKVIAREWLYLIAFAFVGLLIPIFLYVFVSPNEYTSKHDILDLYEEIFEGMWGKRTVTSPLVYWGIVFGPYALFQLIRSIVWAYKTLRDS